MADPSRIQLSRRKGARLPEGAVSVARPSRWGNPYTVAGAIEHDWASTEDEARKVAAEFFHNWLLGLESGDQDVYVTGKRAYDRRWMRAHLHELAGKTLACFCPAGSPCHADVLAEAAALAAALRRLEETGDA